MIGKDMLYRSLEWKALSPAAKIVYIYLKSKYNGANNGHVRLYYSEFKGIKGLVSHSTISRAFRELEKGGWIKRNQIGGLHRHFNEYFLTGSFDKHIN